MEHHHLREKLIEKQQLRGECTSYSEEETENPPMKRTDKHKFTFNDLNAFQH